MTKEGNIRAVLETNFSGFKEEIIDSVVNILMEVTEVRRGRWIKGNHRPKCSICGSPIPIRKMMLDGEIVWEDKSPDNYCSNCGAKMESILASSENGQKVEDNG